MFDTLDEWSNWRGRVVQYKHHTYCNHEKSECQPKTDGIDYVIVGGDAARYIRKHAGPIKDKDDYLVLVPITRDTDEDSFMLVLREDIVES